MPIARLGLLALLSGGAVSQPATPDWRQAVSQNLTIERVVGLLNLPEVVGDGCGPDAAGSVALYGAQSTAAAPIGSIRLRVTEREPGGGSCGTATVIVQRADSAEEQLPTDESGYEVQAALVYQRSGLWFRVALQRGSAWVKRDRADDFLAYPKLLSERLAYVRAGWDGRLRPSRQTSAWFSSRGC